jgi:hypothetical protein
MKPARIKQNSNKYSGIANLTPFKPGQTGNPNGRPLGQRNYETLYRDALIKLAELNDKKPDELETEMLSNAIKLARGGNYSFYKDILDRLHGQAVSRSENKNLNENVNISIVPEILAIAEEELRKRKMKSIIE